MTEEQLKQIEARTDKVLSLKYPSVTAIFNGLEHEAMAAHDFFLGAQQDIPALVAEVRRLREVGNEISSIMKSYREQVATGCLDTPGGLEHMGDVWRLLSRWDSVVSPQENEEMKNGSR